MKPTTSQSQHERKPVPIWIVLLLIIGVPTVMITLGMSLGAAFIEMMMFSILCLFGLALVYFMR
ncbi:MAG: hypothetical protein JNJ77_06305 [Planctomycetia bacterium]|nr:hypothetical protein [Planctomycetia bacterium]